MVAGSFVLTPATALRYERHDRRVQQVDQQEALALGIKDPDGNSEKQIKLNPRRRILGNEREEYYVRIVAALFNCNPLSLLTSPLFYRD